MVGWLGVALGIEGLVSIALAVLLVARSTRKTAVWALAGSLVVLGIALVLAAAARLSAFTYPTAWVVVLVAAGSFLFLLLAIAYPTWRRRAATVWALVWASIPFVFLLAEGALSPDALVARDGSPTITFIRVVALLEGASFVVITGIFARRWLATGPEGYRRQFLFVLFPLLLWDLNDGFAFVFSTLSVGNAPSGPPPVELRIVGALQLAAVVVLAALALRRALLRAGRSARDDRMLILFVVVASLLSTVQLFVAGSHLVIDGLAPPLLFYGVAKYNILDIDLRLKSGIRRGALGGVALAIVLVVEQALQQLVGATFGVALGALVAGLSLFALTPLRRAAERLSERAMPRVAPTEAYFTYRKFELYRVALEGAIRDGVEELSKAATLSGLRERLGISLEEHALIEQEVRVVQASGPPAREPKIA